MSLKPKRRLMGRCDDLVLLYAGLFLACASISSFGSGALGLALFIALALIFSLFSADRPADAGMSQECQS